MGVARCESIVCALVAGGLSEDTPAAVVSDAHTPQQRHAVCTLGTLALTLQTQGIASPAVMVIGQVAAQALLAQRNLNLPTTSESLCA